LHGSILKARITVRETLNDYGSAVRPLQASGRLAHRIRFFDNTLILALRNTFTVVDD
jgi:hypothetical protein